jgi:hypothetical protein
VYTPSPHHLNFRSVTQCCLNFRSVTQCCLNFRSASLQHNVVWIFVLQVCNTMLILKCFCFFRRFASKLQGNLKSVWEGEKDRPSSRQRRGRSVVQENPDKPVDGINSTGNSVFNQQVGRLYNCLVDFVVCMGGAQSNWAIGLNGQKQQKPLNLRWATVTIYLQAH